MSSRRDAPELVRRIDHVVVAVRNLASAMDSYRAIGFEVEPGGRHTGRGTHNAIIRFGLDYLELLSVYDAGIAEAHGGNALELVRFLERTPGGLIGFALATDDIERLASQWHSSEVPLVGPIPMERVRPDGRRLRWRLLLPGGSGWCRPWPFVIQWDASDEERLQIEAPRKHGNRVVGIAGVGVMARTLTDRLSLYTDSLGLGLAEHGAVGAIYNQAEFAVGEFRIQLVESSASTGGEGIFQVDLTVDDLESAVAVTGATASKAGYVVPGDHTCGARIVLVEPTEAG
jgi:catechol 2,3-dioxygenase-like lactoylglutathione lyase family enzyme